MKLTILGCSGSVGGPKGPASGYLVSVPDAPSLLMDIGPGVLARLQEVQNPSDAHVVFSHLHADHCLDFPSLLVWRRFHPELAAKCRHLCFGPEATSRHLGPLSSDREKMADDMSDTFAFTPWTEGKAEQIDRLQVTPFRVVHPVETYALRVTDSTGTTLTYSGDSAYTENLVAAAGDADVFLCEATWGKEGNGPVPNMHMDGAEAGRIAQAAGVGKLVLIHIPPWGDPEGAKAAAEQYYDGPVELGYAGMELELGESG